MISIVEVYSLSLLVVSLAVFVIRYIRHEPPIVPYLVIASVCAVSNWLAGSGGGVGAVVLLIGASFLLLSRLLSPEREVSTQRSMFRRGADKTAKPTT